MKGTKRFAVSESAPDTNDSAFCNKRIMGGSLLDVHRAEPSQRQSMSTPPLDMQRAESSRQHVRALNTQFASWVQTQLKNHPDELWEDGVQDYLAHASNIMEKFSEVVEWLRANALKAGNSSAAEPHTTEKKLASEIKNNDVKFSQEKAFTPSTTSFGTSGSFGLYSSSSASGSSGLFSNIAAPSGSFGPFSNNATSSGTSLLFSNNVGSSGSSGLFSNSAASSGSSGLFSNNATTGSSGVFSNSAASWSSGVFSHSQSPVLFGNQSLLPPNNNASNDADDEDELPRPSSPSVKKSEEKGIIVVHEVKCKLYVKSSDPADKDMWKDKGTGQLSIKCKEGVSKGTKESKPTVVVRNDVGKVLLNALLYPGIKTNLQKNSLVAIFHTSGDDAGSNESVVARTFLFRTKTEEDRNKLATAIQEHAPSS